MVPACLPFILAMHMHATSFRCRSPLPLCPLATTFHHLWLHLTSASMPCSATAARRAHPPCTTFSTTLILQSNYASSAAAPCPSDGSTPANGRLGIGSVGRVARCAIRPACEPSMARPLGSLLLCKGLSLGERASCPVADAARCPRYGGMNGHLLRCAVVMAGELRLELEPETAARWAGATRPGGWFVGPAGVACSPGGGTSGSGSSGVSAPHSLSWFALHTLHHQPASRSVQSERTIFNMSAMAPLVASAARYACCRHRQHQPLVQRSCWGKLGAILRGGIS